jgi:hypothetical protein
MSNFDADSYSWYVVHTHPKKEDRTCENLIAWGVEEVQPVHRQSYSDSEAILPWLHLQSLPLQRAVPQNPLHQRRSQSNFF